MKNKFSKNAIKESFDNLPSGVCYFAQSGILFLCNRTMHRLIYMLTGQRLQIMADIERLLAFKNIWVLPDSTVWRLSKKEINADNQTYFEYIAADITELYTRKNELEKSTREYRKLIASVKKTMRNTVEIAREEEMLALKMRVHGKVGWCLQQIRRFHANNCPEKSKDEIISDVYDVIRMLKGETEYTDENDSYTELAEIAKKLGVEIVIAGTMPKHERAQNIFLQALRENITNTVRHAQGDRVLAWIEQSNDEYTFVFRNNGIQPDLPITEGGGLGALRKMVESYGGTMITNIIPEFSLTISVPKEREEEKK